MTGEREIDAHRGEEQLAQAREQEIKIMRQSICNSTVWPPSSIVNAHRGEEPLVQAGNRKSRS
jgi:hypothetical protein